MDFGEALVAAQRTRYYSGWEDLRASDKDKLPGLLSVLTSADFVEFDFLRSVEDETYICSPEGVLLRFDMRSLNNRIEYWEASYENLIETSTSVPGLPTIPVHFKRMYELVLESVAGVINEAERSNITIAKAADELGYDYFHQRLPFFYERVGHTISLAAFDYMQLLVSSGARLPKSLMMDWYGIDGEFMDAQNLLRPFVGWAICVPQAFFENDWSARMLNNGRPPESRAGSNGRPPVIRSETLRAYRKLYPDGHGREPWLQVLRRVNKVTGQNASVDTLKRAVGEDNIAAKPSA